MSRIRSCPTRCPDFETHECVSDDACDNSPPMTEDEFRDECIAAGCTFEGCSGGSCDCDCTGSTPPEPEPEPEPPAQWGDPDYCDENPMDVCCMDPEICGIFVF